MLRFCLAGEYPLDTEKIGGGMSHVTYILGEAFAERGDIDFHVVTPVKGRSDVRVVTRPGMTIHYVGTPKHGVLPHLITQGHTLASVFADIKPDVVNSHHYVTTDGAVRAGCKVAHTVHGVIHKEIRYMGRREKLARVLHATLEKRAVSKCDAAIGVAQYAIDSYAKWIRSQSFTMHVPIEDMFWDTPPMGESKSIVFAGGICRRKNLIALIRAMAKVAKRHPDAVLRVCGHVVEPEYMAAVKSLIERDSLHDAIDFLGVVDRYRLASLLAESCALALPSYQESSPGVICQAMGAGRVSVVSPVGGVPEMIEDGVTGFLVDADDSDTLADRLIGLFDDLDRAKQMGSAARAVALERYDRHKVADSILSICSSLVGGDFHG